MLMKRIFNIIVYTFAAIGFVLIAVYGAVQLGWTKGAGIVDTQHDYFKNQLSHSSTTPPQWTRGEEWNALKVAIIKDQEVITRAATQLEISPRLIVSILIVEQLRLFHSDRELFKTVFAPLKILATQSQFSWGVMGIKQDTARTIEDNLKNKQSPWYINTHYEHLFDYASSTNASDIDSERFARLTNEDDRYYSYLYAAVLLRELQSQWERAGFPIHAMPGILATLFNIGFANSHPNPAPKSGGAEIQIQSTTYSFGGLAQSFYDSDELIAEFPR